MTAHFPKPLEPNFSPQKRKKEGIEQSVQTFYNKKKEGIEQLVQPFSTKEEKGGTK